MKVGDYEILEGLVYTKNHEWMRVEEGKCRVGITDYAQKSLHDIVFVDPPRIGTEIDQGQTIGSVESVKAVAEVYAPISGEIIEINARLVETPELLNQKPYQEGWIAILRPARLDEEMKTLLDAKAYGEFLENQAHK
ncbi:MAG: glycine cleavage system protein GcvH [archaeon]